MKRSLLAGLAAWLILGSVSLAAAPSSAQPKYVFLFIGDGMGPGQRQLAALTARQRTGGEPRMETFPVRGLAHTCNVEQKLTDSAAAATALSSGVKTKNGMLGMSADGKPVEGICDRLKKVGMKTGLITSVPLNHATPAGFYSHAQERGSYDDIALQFPQSGVDLLAGNGVLGKKSPDEFIAAWKKGGCEVVTAPSQVAGAPLDKPLVVLLDFPDAWREKSDASNPRGQLADMTAAAAERLAKNPRGFFLMIEGGKVDWACHSNLAGEAADEALAMDRAVQAACEFYDKHPADTLILVTADHETGGLTIDEKTLDLPRLAELTGKSEPLAAAIKKAKPATVEGVAPIAAEVLGLSNLSDGDKTLVRIALVEQLKKDKGQVARALMSIAQNRAGVSWTTGGHTGVDVPVTALGAGADAFAGTYDNTEIPKRIESLCGAVRN